MKKINCLFFLIGCMFACIPLFANPGSDSSLSETDTFQKLSKENNILKEQLSSLKKEFETAKQTLGKRECEIKSFESQVSKSKQEIEKFRAKNKELEDNIRSVEETISQLKADIKKLQEENAEKEGKIKKLIDEHSPIGLHILIFIAILTIGICGAICIISKKHFEKREYHQKEQNSTIKIKEKQGSGLVETSKKKELRCPLCGWKYNPGDKVCKNCRTQF